MLPVLNILRFYNRDSGSRIRLPSALKSSCGLKLSKARPYSNLTLIYEKFVNYVKWSIGEDIAYLIGMYIIRSS